MLDGLHVSDEALEIAPPFLRRVELDAQRRDLAARLDVPRDAPVDLHRLAGGRVLELHPQRFADGHLAARGAHQHAGAADVPVSPPTGPSAPSMVAVTRAVVRGAARRPGSAAADAAFTPLAASSGASCSTVSRTLATNCTAGRPGVAPVGLHLERDDVHDLALEIACRVLAGTRSASSHEDGGRAARHGSPCWRRTVPPFDEVAVGIPPRSASRVVEDDTEV